MNFADIIFLAFALSIDASVVSFSQGLIINENKLKNALILALFVGISQAVMPIIGWFFANFIYRYIAFAGGIIAFSIFFILGLKFILDAIHKKDCETPQNIKKFTIPFLLIISIATSIDALGAGINIKILSVSIIFSSIIIGLVTFINSLVSFFTAQKLKCFPTKNMEILGGIILIFLAIKSILQ